MEILAEYTTRSNIELIALIVATVIGAMFIVFALWCIDYGFGATSFYGILGIAFLLVWLIPPETRYDAIITDWNVVHEQGYEVVETNGKIVTLRKVGE